MKLIIQIPCYNEVETLPLTMRDLSNALPGKDVNEYLGIDHANPDLTPEVALQAGIQHIIRLHPHHRSLFDA
jgi:glycosyltransferase involved in cell wall biosynthesis